jgi:GT2 family glycosyltransferase
MNEQELNPTVSVVIVSWNARDYLRHCLESLTPKVCRCPMEIIVVDNASTDGSKEEVTRQFPHVRLLCNDTNQGFAKANNLGISASTGRYVCLVNSDVKVLPDCITRLVEFCESQPETGIAGPRIIGGDGKLQRSCRGFPGLWNMFCRALALDTIFCKSRVFTGFDLSYWPQDSQRSVDILSGCFWLVRRSALAEVGVLDESFFMYGEDFDWCKRFWNRGWKVSYVPSGEAIHYGGASSSNAPVRFFVEKQRADFQYWRKHRRLPAVCVYYLIAAVHQLIRCVGYGVVSIVSPHSRASAQHKLRRSIACLRWMFGGKLPASSCR